MVDHRKLRRAEKARDFAMQKLGRLEQEMRLLARDSPEWSVRYARVLETDAEFMAACMAVIAARGGGQVA